VRPPTEQPPSPPDHVDVVIIGGGMAGLSAADTLRARGHSVRVLEAGETVGGLARAIHVGGEPIEAYYHHIFPQDSETIELLERLGLSDRLEWKHGPMAILHEGRIHRFDSPLDLLRFDPLSIVARLRLGLATSIQLFRPDRRTLDRRSAAAEARRWFGRSAWELIWRPLLISKFGPEYFDRVVMAWLVARLRQRAGARRANGDQLGYLRGSLGTLIDAYAEAINASGAGIETGARVSNVARDGDGWVVDFERDGDSHTLRASTVVAAVAGPVLSRLVELPGAYRSSLDAIPYRGVVCVLLELDRPLGPNYWVNVTDQIGLGCVGIIEHTNFIPSSRYGGRSVVYLAHYVERDGPAWKATADELIAAVEPSLRAIQPAFDRDWIKATHVSRDSFAQPVPLVGGPMSTLPVATGLPGLYHASLAHIYPDDRGVSLALRLGQRVAQEAGEHLATLAR